MKSILWLVACAAFAGSPTTAIKINQAGYLPGAAKIALVAAEAEGDEFLVRESPGGTTAFRGTLSAAREDADSGSPVRWADFTALQEPGAYYLEVPGTGSSWEFRIAADVYARPYYLALRSFYGQRCGVAVDLGPEFPGYTHEACHLSGGWHASSGKTGEAESAKGWHDAGDYGRYIVNSGISTGTLLWAYEMFAAAIGGVNLNIPEYGNDTPDILDEIRWNLDWMLTLQDSDGGVWHKQTSERFPGFLMPEKDTLQSVVIGTGFEPFKSSCATGDFAAVMAIAGRIYPKFDSEFAERALAAAERAWTWLEKNPNVIYRNPAGVATGEYGDGNCSDECLWAAAELARSTGGPAYDAYFLANYARHRESIRPIGPPSWPSVGALALWTYALSPRAGGEAAATIRADSLRAAAAIVERTAGHAYRHSMTTRDFVWGSNGVAGNYGMQLLVANAMQPDPRYRAAALDNLHYLLGRNYFSLSWVTQVGANPFRHPHHRPSGADTNPEPWPGLLSGGPNGRKQDPAMENLPDLPPARMYLDEQASYASNENAINWNAPLVFLLAGVSNSEPDAQADLNKSRE